MNPIMIIGIGWLILGITTLVSVKLYGKKNYTLGFYDDDLLFVVWLLIILMWPIVISIVATMLFLRWLRKKKI